MTQLFSDDAGAVLSPCGKYRYRLWRRWGEEAPLCFIMLNPSTADQDEDDPTIRKCIGFARRLGHGALEVVNLFAWRCTDPAGLRRAIDPGGPENDAAIAATLASVDAKGGAVVCAWGANGFLELRRVAQVLRLIEDTPGLVPHALRINLDGTPAHPLMLPYHLKPSAWDEGT